MNKRIEQLAELLQHLMDGENPKIVKDKLAEQLNQVSVQELADAEAQLATRGFAVEDIQRASTLHTELVFDRIKQNQISDRPDDESGHPARVFRGENEGLQQFVDDRLLPDLEKFIKTLNERDRLDLLSDAHDLSGVTKHYDRKENLFFPFLEQNGITVPPKVMWGVDDIIRELLRLFMEAIEEKPVVPKRIQLIADRLITQIEGMIVKENDILLPLLFEHMTESDWVLTAQESRIIGYVFNQGIEGASNSDAETWLMTKTKGVSQVLPAVDDSVNLPSGHLTLEQLTAMLNTLPTDLTFVDSDDVIRYYSEGKHQVFLRTRTIIGRDLYLCHPPQLVPTIRKLIKAFKAGEKDEEIVLMKKGSLHNLIRYYAVRNEQGEYLGALEVTEEISAIIEKI